MPKHSRKRKRDEDSGILKKIRKLEKKLKRRRRRSSSSSTEYSSSDTSSREETTPQDKSDSDSLDRYYDFLLDEDNVCQNNSASVPTSIDLPSIPGVSSNDTISQTFPNNDLPKEDQAAQQVSTDKNSQSSNQAVTQTTSNEPELDKDILDLLGETPSKEKKYGPSFKNELSVRWYHILTSGLPKETRKDLIDRYLIPENYKNIDAPILNPETKAALSEPLVKKDKAIESKQKQRAAALSSLGEALTHLFDLGYKEPSVVKPLLDAARLICDLQHHDFLVRRSFICCFKRDVKDQLYNTEIDKYLFSEKLADTLKAAKAIQKSGTDMKIPTQQKAKKTVTANRPNLKPPPPNYRPAGVSRKQEPAAESSRRHHPAQPTTSASTPTRPRLRSQVQRRR